MRHRVQTKEKGQFLLEYFPGAGRISTRQVKRAIKEHRMTVNGKRAYRDTIVRNGDWIDLKELEEESTIVPEEIPLDILYEDDSLLAVNKPAGLLVHPTKNVPNGTLANGVSSYYISTFQRHAVRFYSRLDRDTSGVVLIPKCGNTHRDLMEANIEKCYIAVAEGHLKKQQGQIFGPIGKASPEDIKYAVCPEGKEAETEYRVMEELGEVSLLELRLVTGRTHQIRVHLSHMGHPIVGDTLYGRPSAWIQRQALHASSIRFLHPMTKEMLKIVAPLPLDMKQLIAQLVQSSGGDMGVTPQIVL